MFDGATRTAHRPCAGSAAGGVVSAAVHEVRVAADSSARGVAAGVRRSAGGCGSGWPQKSVGSRAASPSA